MSSRNPFAGLDPNAVFARLVSLGDEWAEQDGAAAMYDETRKPLLAQVALVYLKEHGGSQARADAVALASPEYREHVEAMVAARKAALKAKVRYDSARVWADHARSLNANRRVEAQLGGLAA